jgi:REP element-mobilizing transposase RayT
MPRARRELVPGAVYHVYNRVTRGERVFQDEAEAGRLLAWVAKTKKRDDFVVLAFCVMSNHYHLAVRMGPVPLSRSMRTIHQRYTQSFNGRHGVLGPLWQGRYKAKLVEDMEQLWRLIPYIHLNPVAAGIVEDPGEYRFSGHRELVGRRRKRGLVDVDQALMAYGQGRREALRMYRASMAAARGEEWLGEGPGQLPWWRLGRPRAKLRDNGLEIDVERARIGLDGRSTEIERPELDIEEFLDRGAWALDCSVRDLIGRSRLARLVEARQILTVVAVERYGFLVKDMADAFERYGETASRWISQATSRRQLDVAFRERIVQVDRAIAREEDREAVQTVRETGHR